MHPNPKVSTYVSIREGCRISYRVNNTADVEFTCGTARDGFEFVFDAEALREFLSLGTDALREMDDLRARDES